jgi:hypothetical protein
MGHSRRGCGHVADGSIGILRGREVMHGRIDGPDDTTARTITCGPRTQRCPDVQEAWLRYTPQSTAVSGLYAQNVPVFSEFPRCRPSRGCATAIFLMALLIRHVTAEAHVRLRCRAGAIGHAIPGNPTEPRRSDRALHERAGRGRCHSARSRRRFRAEARVLAPESRAWPARRVPGWRNQFQADWRAPGNGCLGPVARAIWPDRGNVSGRSAAQRDRRTRCSRRLRRDERSRPPSPVPPDERAPGGDPRQDR